MTGPILFYRVRTNNTLLYGKEMDDDENIFRNNWRDLSITHFTYNDRIDCCNPYRRVCNSNTILGLVDSGFDIAIYSYCKTNQKLSIAKMRVLIGLLFFFFFAIFTDSFMRKEMINMKKKRGTFGLIVDFLLTIFTGGLWLIWLIIKYLRTH